jgi:hypothetical protein
MWHHVLTISSLVCMGNVGVRCTMCAADVSLCVHSDSEALSKHQSATADAFLRPRSSIAFWAKTKTLKLAGQLETPALYRMPAGWPCRGLANLRRTSFRHVLSSPGWIVGQCLFVAFVECSDERVCELCGVLFTGTQHVIDAGSHLKSAFAL